MKIRVGDFVKMQDAACDCVSCEEAASKYHKVLSIEEKFEEDSLILEGVSSFFPIHCADWSVKPINLENK